MEHKCFRGGHDAVSGMLNAMRQIRLLAIGGYGMEVGIESASFLKGGPAEGHVAPNGGRDETFVRPPGELPGAGVNPSADSAHGRVLIGSDVLGHESRPAADVVVNVEDDLAPRRTKTEISRDADIGWAQVSDAEPVAGGNGEFQQRRAGPFILVDDRHVVGGIALLQNIFKSSEQARFSLESHDHNADMGLVLHGLRSQPLLNAYTLD